MYESNFKVILGTKMCSLGIDMEVPKSISVMLKKPNNGELSPGAPKIVTCCRAGVLNL